MFAEKRASERTKRARPYIKKVISLMTQHEIFFSARLETSPAEIDVASEGLKATHEDLVLGVGG